MKLFSILLVLTSLNITTPADDANYTPESDEGIYMLYEYIHMHILVNLYTIYSM